MEKKKLNILVVEDELLVAADIEESLTALGYHVQNTVATGQAAIEEVDRKLPDIILMDIILKGEMTGIDAAKAILENHNVPIIYLTANADTSTVEKAKTSLPYGYIIKPFNDKELQTIIEIARFKFENDIITKFESDQFNRFFRKINEEGEEPVMVESVNGLEKIWPSDVYYIEYEDEICHVHLLNEVVKVKSTIEYFLTRLPSNLFMRINKYFIVNLKKILMIKLPEIVIANKLAVITIDKEQIDSFLAKL